MHTNKIKSAAKRCHPLRWMICGLGLGALFGCAEVRVPDPNVQYIAFGDSSTDGPSETPYPVLLREQLGAPPDSFAIESQDGETSEEGLIRLRSLFAMDLFPNAHTLLYWQGAAEVLDFIGEVDPLIVLSPASANYPFGGRLADVLNRVEGNIEAIVEEAQSRGLTVYVATYYTSREAVAPCDALFLDTIIPSQASNANDYIALLNQRIRQATQDTGAILVDVATLDDELRTTSANYFDCNHLSTQGNTLVAELFADIITSQSQP